MAVTGGVFCLRVGTRVVGVVGTVSHSGVSVESATGGWHTILVGWE